MEVIRDAIRTGGAPNVSDAYTINGQPGDLYDCAKKGLLYFTKVFDFERSLCLTLMNRVCQHRYIFSGFSKILENETIDCSCSNK